MADQKKTPRRTSARKSAVKAAVPETAASAAPSRKARGRRVKAAPKAVATGSVASLFDTRLPEEMRTAIAAAESIAPRASSPFLPAGPDSAAAPAAQAMELGTEQARQTYDRARTAGESLRQAMTKSAQATTLGALEVNGKVIEALRAQSDAAFDLWRAALATGSLSEAVSLQTSGARQVYETATSHWADVAESARRWLGETVKPIQSAWTDQTR